MAEASNIHPIFLAGGGEMGGRMREHDWASTPLGPPETWPQHLRVMVSTLLNSPLLGAVLWGPELLLLYNDAYVPALLERHPDALGRPLREVWPDIWDQLSGPFEGAFRTGQSITQDRFVLPITRHGKREETFWNYSVSPIRDEDGCVAGLLNNAIEITAQVRAEQRQQEAEAQLRLANTGLQQQVTDRTADIDRAWRLSQDLLVIARPDGVLEAVNPLWIALLGWSEQDLVGKSFITFTHPDDRQRTAEVFKSIFERPLNQPYEYRFQHKDGTYRWIGWTAAFEAGKVYASGRDVTRDRERDSILRDTQDFARLALSAVGGVGVWTYEVDRDLFFYDAAIAKLYDLDPARGQGGILREEFLANVHPDDRAALKATMAGGLVNPGDLELEYRLRHSDGSLHWVLSRGHTYHDDSGHPVRRTGVGVETTNQRKIEEALRQSQKMEAVGQLTGGLAHDFNNLLAGITGSLELMGIRLKQGRISELDRFMTVAQGAAKRAASLTHRLLAFSRRQTLDPRPTDVNRLVQGMHEMIQRTVGPGIPVEVVEAPSLWTVLVDAPQLENALLNLCINARDAMPDGGRITIETANKWLDARAARERSIAEGQYLSLCVTDTGTGMPPEVIGRVFEPFFTTKPIGEGTGLGLSMVHGFANQSGGQVRIYSELGQGTTVCIYLPRHYGDVDQAEYHAETAPLPHSEAGETVLIVDDEPSVRMLVTEILEDLGYTSIEAADSVAGLRVLMSDVPIDLLVTDVGLPGGMNGRQMADAARKARPDLKVLFITGYAENAVLGNGYLAPGMAMMTKPFSVEAMAARIRATIETPVT